MELGSIARQIQTHKTTAQCICVKMCAQTEAVAPVSLVLIGNCSPCLSSTPMVMSILAMRSQFHLHKHCQSQLEVIFIWYQSLSFSMQQAPCNNATVCKQSIITAPHHWHWPVIGACSASCMTGARHSPVCVALIYATLGLQQWCNWMQWVKGQQKAQMPRDSVSWAGIHCWSHGLYHP